MNVRLNIARAFGSTLLEGWKLSDEILAFIAPALEKNFEKVSELIVWSKFKSLIYHIYK